MAAALRAPVCEFRQEFAAADCGLSCNPAWAPVTANGFHCEPLQSADASQSMSYARLCARDQDVLAHRGREDGSPSGDDGWCALRLSRSLSRGELSGYRVGRTWRMTREDVEDLIERHRKHRLPRVAQEPRTDVVSGLAPTSRLRLMRSDSRSMVIASTASPLGDCCR